MSERKKNGCGLTIDPIEGIGFSCIEANGCGFRMKNQEWFCDHHWFGDCTSENARKDALNRAFGAINEELCRRANDSRTWTEEHQKKAEAEADFIRRTLGLDDERLIDEAPSVEETVERSR